MTSRASCRSPINEVTHATAMLDVEGNGAGDGCSCHTDDQRHNSTALVSLARSNARNSGSMLGKPPPHLAIRPCPFKRMGIPLIVLRPRSGHVFHEVVLGWP